MLRRYAMVFVAALAIVLPMTSREVSASSLSILPLRQELQLKPGQTVEKKLTVFNATDTPETVKVNATSFNTVDKQYNYEFGAPPDLSGWIQFIEDSASLQPGGQHEFKYNIAVPNDAEPGGKYIAVFASITSQAKTAGQPHTIIERVGSLIYLNVTGKISKLGSLVSYTTPKISFSKVNAWDLEIQNKGNTHFTSALTTELSEWPGTAHYKANQKHLILPGTIRELSGKYTLGSWPSLYKLHMTIGLGDNPTAYRSYWLVYLPPLTSIIIASLLLIGIGVMVKRLRRGAKYKRSR